MDKELKLKWLEALKSGTYTKTTYRVIRKAQDNTFDVIGVLLDVVDPNGWILHKDNTYFHKLSWGTGSIKIKVLASLGLDTFIESKLIYLNDHNKDWTQVIKFIEETL